MRSLVSAVPTYVRWGNAGGSDTSLGAKTRLNGEAAVDASVRMEETKPEVILHLEDSDGFAALVGELLEGADFTVHRARTLAEAQELAVSRDFACAFIDLDLPDASGLQAVSGMRSSAPALPLVVLSGLDVDTAPVKAVLLGAQDWVAKHDISPQRLTTAMAMAIARRDAQAHAVWQAAHDLTTGLPNRTLAIEHLLRAIDRTRRRGVLTGLLFCDLDNFKQVNDLCGHAAGDKLLCTIALRLIHAVRPGDMVARWGGDEFLIITEGIDTADEALAIARRVRAHVGQPFPMGDQSHQPAITIGIALAHSTADVHCLIDQADRAMLDAKKRGTGISVAE